MENVSYFKKEIVTSAEKRILYLPHAVKQMSKPERMITTDEIREIVLNGNVIEDYPEDVRGHSCLMLGFGKENRPLHVVCAPKNEYLVIITAYIPNSEEWSGDFSRRVKK